MIALDPALEFFFIRHGETAWNKEGRLQGQRDIPLNPLGRDQAASAGRSLGQLLRRRGVPEPSRLDFVSSPLGRAVVTMELARTALGLPARGSRTDDQLRELAFGDWEGMTWGELKKRAPEGVRTRKRNKWAFVPPGGESYADLADRLRPWLSTVKHHDVVVAHGGVARALMHLVAGCSVDDAPDVDIWQGRVLIFKDGGCRWD